MCSCINFYIFCRYILGREKEIERDIYIYREKEIGVKSMRNKMEWE